MHVSSIWFDFEVHSVLNEKLNTERCSSNTNNNNITTGTFDKSVLSGFVAESCEFLSLRLSFSISTDWSMLYYSLSSIFQYLDRSDSVTCRRYNQNVSVLVDISFTYSKLSNRLFYLLFYMCIFSQDMETDFDCVYQFWTHGRTIFAISNSTLHFRRRNIAFDSVYSAYFISKFDANLWYNIRFDMETRTSHSLRSLLVCSLYYLSFVNTSLKHSLLFMHG